MGIKGTIPKGWSALNEQLTMVTLWLLSANFKHLRNIISIKHHINKNPQKKIESL